MEALCVLDLAFKVGFACLSQLCVRLCTRGHIQRLRSCSHSGSGYCTQPGNRHIIGICRDLNLSSMLVVLWSPDPRYSVETLYNEAAIVGSCLQDRMRAWGNPVLSSPSPPPNQ